MKRRGNCVLRLKKMIWARLYTIPGQNVDHHGANGIP